jgi:hypothetical protein
MDMYEKSLKMFLDENKVEKENTLVVFYHHQTYAPMVKLTNVISWTELNYFVHWTDGMISNFQEYYKGLNIFKLPKQEWD